MRAACASRYACPCCCGDGGARSRSGPRRRWGSDERTGARARAGERRAGCSPAGAAGGRARGGAADGGRLRRRARRKRGGGGRIGSGGRSRSRRGCPSSAARLVEKAAGGRGAGRRSPRSAAPARAHPAPGRRTRGDRPRGGGGAVIASFDRPRYQGQRGLLASAAAAVESFFLEPGAPRPASEAAEPVELRPVVSVFGLARGCGATVVARALAAELALRNPSGAAAVACDARPAGLPLATHAATRLARALEDVPGAFPRAVGRLCLIGGADPLRLAGAARHHAPLVIDAGSDALGGAAASVADRTILVATRDVEPALATVAAECVARVGPAPAVVLNRAPHDQPGL